MLSKVVNENMMITWEDYQKEKCVPVEDDLLDFKFNNRDLLIRALTRSAFFNQAGYLTEHKDNWRHST